MLTKQRWKPRHDLALTAAEEAKVLDAADAWLADSNPQLQRAGLFGWVLLATGLRWTEASALTCEDIDRTNRVIRVLRLKKRDGPAEDFIPLARALAQRLPDRMAGPLFLQCWGKKANRWTLRRDWNLLTAAAKVRPLGCHSARHRFATRLGEMKADAYTIAEALGHESLDMAIGYMHHAEAELGKALDRWSAGYELRNAA